MHERFGCTIHGSQVFIDYEENEEHERAVDFGKLMFHADRLSEPSGWRSPQVVFVGSMTDMFHEQVQAEWIRCVCKAMLQAPHHTYVILTKRPERLIHDRFTPLRDFYMLRNLYIGVSVEDQATAETRIPALLGVCYGRTVVSYEPALGPVRLAGWLDRLSGVIAGAETGPGARPADPDWFRTVRDECEAYGVQFFLKQINARRERTLDGRTHDDLPWRIEP